MFIEASRKLQYAQLQAFGFRAHDIQLGRGTARVYTGGSGPIMLILHGAQGGAMEHIGWMLPELAKRYRVIAPDMPGMADSRTVIVPEEATIPKIAALLHTLLDRLGVHEPLRLAGGSMGGWVGMRMVLQRPERFTRMVLGSPAGLPIRMPLKEAAIAIVPETAEQWEEGFHLLTRRVGRLPRWLLADMVATFRTVNPVLRVALRGDHYLTDDELRQLTLPTLIVWGEDDELIPVENGRHMAAVMPNARLLVVPDCGHAFIMDAPDFCLPALLAGLREPGEEEHVTTEPTAKSFFSQIADHLRQQMRLAGTVLQGEKSETPATLENDQAA